MQAFTSKHWFHSKNIRFYLKAAHGRCEGVNSNQAIMRVQRAGFFPNKTNQVTSFQVIMSPPIPPESSNCSDGALQISDGDLHRMSFSQKKAPSLIFTRQVKGWSAEANLGPASPELSLGEGENSSNNSQLMSILNPHPAENTETFFSSLGVLLSPSLIL